VKKEEEKKTFLSVHSIKAEERRKLLRNKQNQEMTSDICAQIN
jgi:NifB/MoaA-like Fe-S oxidoreductase